MVTKAENISKKKKSTLKEIEPKTRFQISRIKEFLTDVKSEFGKIVWPVKKQTLGSTAVVLVLVAVMAVYLGTIDLVLGKLISLILS